MSSGVRGSQMLMGDGGVLAAGDGDIFNFVLNTGEGLCV